MGTITDKLNYLAETKEEIKKAIIGRGQTIIDTDTFRDYATKIANITIVNNQKKSANATSSAAVTLKPDSGYTGLSEATVTPILQAKNANCTSAAAVVLTPDSGYCGLSKATVTPVTETRTHNVSSNGTTTVNVSSGKVGMTKVTVNTNVLSALNGWRTLHYSQEWGSGSVTLTKTFTCPANKYSILDLQVLQASAGSYSNLSVTGAGLSATVIQHTENHNPMNGQVNVIVNNFVIRITNTSGVQQTATVKINASEGRALLGTVIVQS